MSVSSDFREANVFFNEIKQAFEQARQRFENDVSRLAGLSDDDPIASSAASGWKNWTKSLRSHVLGVAAETHTSNEMVQAILGSSVHTDPDTRLIFADETGMPRLNQEYKTISSETPSRLGRTAVTNEASDAVGQLGVPARSQAGDMSQAVIHVKNTNPWPCTETIAKTITASLPSIGFGAFNQVAQQNFWLAQQLELHAAANMSALNITPGMSVIVYSARWRRQFRFTGTKVFCDGIK